jgi:hypothetical protein
MKQLGGLVLAALILMGCKKSDSCTPAQYSYIYQEKKRIDTIRPGGYFLATQINPGNSIVFSYDVVGRFCKGWSDGPSSENLVFEAVPQATHFEYSSNNIKDVQCYYDYYTGDGSNINASKILEGTISGVKISENTWRIEASVLIPNMNKTLTFNHTFKLQ